MADTAETTEKAKLINDIVNMEWDFFQKTQNVGGRADCQDQLVTFGIMRRSQFRHPVRRRRMPILGLLHIR